MQNTTTRALVAAMTMTTMLTAGALAQDAYPSSPVTILVPAAAGGPSDTVTRLVAQSMSETLGQQVLVENMGGAGGSLGAGTVAMAEPDGYTLLLYHVGVATFAALYPDLPYQPIDAFSSIGLVTEVPMTLVGRADLPPADIGELLQLLRDDGASLTFGTAGVGAVSDLCGMLLSQALDMQMTVVPYQGTGPAMTDLLGGQIDLMCDQTTNTANQIEAGDVKAYAVTTAERIERFPDLPTVAESGVEGFEVTAWHALWAPAGTPDAIRETLAAALQTALADPTVIERFASLGTAPVAADRATPAALDEHFRSQIDLWTNLIANVERPAQ